MTRPADQTTSVHGDGLRDRPYRSIATPIFTSSTFSFPSTEQLQAHLQGSEAGFHYGRYGNPTIVEAERHLAALEGAAGAVFTSSGMAALSLTFLSLLRQGQHVLMTSDVYRPTAELLRGLLGRFGVECSIAPNSDIEAIEAALRPETRILFSEQPSNPHTRVVDLEQLVALKKKHRRARLVIDATFASPMNLRPLELGADVVIHSLTKYLAGHNDVIAGVVLGSTGLTDAIREQRALIGCCGDPFGAYQVIRGLKTFSLRMQRHNENALAVARFLEDHPRVRRVWYPGLESHPDHPIAARLFRGGGGVVSFELDGDGAAATRVVDAVRLIQHSASLGGVESLIQQPAIFSWHDHDAESRAAVGIEDALIRLSVGLEQVDDLIADLKEALKA